VAVAVRNSALAAGLRRRLFRAERQLDQGQLVRQQKGVADVSVKHRRPAYAPLGMLESKLFRRTVELYYPGDGEYGLGMLSFTR
jgi:hypothetical protein